MTGGWLRQLGGWEVIVLTDGLAGRIEEGAWAPTAPEADALRIPHVTPAELAVLAGEGAVQVVDLARSIDFRDGHVPGAIWGIRTRLSRLSDRLTGDRQIVVAAPEEAQARLAAAELQGFAKAPVKILAGGTKAWAAAGFPMAADRRDPADADCVDFYLRPYDRNEGVEEAMHAYLSWEIDLVHEVDGECAGLLSIQSAALGHAVVDLLADLHDRIECDRWLLEDHRYSDAADSAQMSTAVGEKVDALEPD